MNIDLRILELAASKICHDLISPIGAVNNGLELMEDEQDMALQAEALALAQRSARRASLLLQLFRSLFGNAGNQSAFGAKEARQLAFDVMQGGKVALDADFSASITLPEGYGKLILAAIIVAAETLPRGGTVIATLQAGPALPLLNILSNGPQIACPEDNLKALQNALPVADLSAHSVLPYFTGLLAKRVGVSCQTDVKTAGQFSLIFAP